MNLILKYLIESSIIITVFYLIYLSFFQNDRTSKFNRAYLILSSLLAVILPLLSIPLLSAPPAQQGISIHQAIQLPEIIINGSAPVIDVQPTLTVSKILIIVYLIGFVLFLTQFLSELLLIWRHVRMNASKTQKNGDYILIHTGGKLPTCSFYKYLFWDDSQTVDEREHRLILKHEEGHIYQKHTIDLIYLEILRIIFWFNPIIHGYKKAMLNVHEFLADEFAMATTNDQGFVSLLGRQFLRRNNLSLSNHFSKSQTLKRIKMIKSEKKKPAVLRWSIMIAAAVTMFYFFSCEEGNAVQEISVDTGNLPVLGDGWSYVSDESLSPWINEKFSNLKSNHPTIEFHVAKGISGKFADFNPTEILEKYGYKAFLFASEGTSFYVFLGKSGEEIVPLPPPEISREERLNEEIFTVVEDPPEFQGGIPALYEYVATHLKYPKEARDAGIEGKVFIEFIVRKDGTVDHVKCIRGIGDFCDSEAVRVISKSPDWIPGKQNGEPVNVRLILPVTFQLSANTTDK